MIGGYPRESGFGCLAVKPESFGFRHLPHGLGLLRMRFAIRGALGLIPAPPPLSRSFLARWRTACARSSMLRNDIVLTFSFDDAALIQKLRPG